MWSKALVVGDVVDLGVGLPVLADVRKVVGRGGVGPEVAGHAHVVVLVAARAASFPWWSRFAGAILSALSASSRAALTIAGIGLLLGKRGGVQQEDARCGLGREGGG